MRALLIFIILVSTLEARCQEIDSDLLKIKSRLDQIEFFRADLKLELDVDFINMPTKYASIEYQKERPVKFSSDDFVMIPKRGLDFSFRELFMYPFITVPVGQETQDGKLLKVLHVIPSDERSELVMVTMKLDTPNQRVAMAQVNTKKDGTYELKFKYDTPDKVLPDDLEVSFQIERIRIPFDFIGKDTEIDRKKMKEEGDKEGRIFLNMSNYQFNR